MQASTILLTNQSSASTINIHSMDTTKIEPTTDGVLVLLDPDEDICPIFYLFDASPFPYKAKPFNPVLVSMDVDRPPHSMSRMKLVRHGPSSQCPPRHLFSSFQVLILSMN